MRFIRMIILLMPFTAAFANEPTPAAAASSVTATTAPAPATAATAAPAAAPAASAAASANDATQPAANPTPQAVAAARAELVKQARAQGYSPVDRKGARYFCRDEAALGTHIEKSVCMSEQGLAERLKTNADARQEWIRAHGCVGLACNNY